MKKYFLVLAVLSFCCAAFGAVISQEIDGRGLTPEKEEKITFFSDRTAAKAK